MLEKGKLLYQMKILTKKERHFTKFEKAGMIKVHIRFSFQPGRPG